MYRKLESIEMGQDNKFYEHGYDHYLKAPKKPRNQSSSVSGMKTTIARNLKSPAVATVALLSAGALFIGVIVATYPSGDNASQPVPIIKADLKPIKEKPIERGGMVIPQRDSTILAQVGQPPSAIDSSQVEDLLADAQEEVMSKEMALEKAMAEHPMSPDDSELQVASENIEDDFDREDLASLSRAPLSDAPLNSGDDVIDRPFDLKEPEPITPLEEPAVDEVEAGDVLQKIGSTNSNDSVGVSEFAKITARAAVTGKPSGERIARVSDRIASRPKEMHAAAQSPETLDFVRSVLNSKSSDSDVRQSGLNDVQPAAGASSVSATALTPGHYFVQLASITDASRAGAEWGKMKNKYPVLSNAQFRVQEASLSSGTFYRIQAGPMSKESADQICDGLKKSGKPGGCLVVK